MATLPTISVLTCERAAGDYVASTLRQIDRQGGRFCERLVFVDGLPEVAEVLERSLAHIGALDGWRVTSLGARLGSTEATRRVLVEATKRKRDLIFCEDDLLLCCNAVERMIELPIPANVSLVSFFDMKEVMAGAANGLYRRPPTGRDGRGFWGNQCFRLPEEVLAWVVEQDWRSTSHGSSSMASDVVLGELLARHPTRPRVAFHIPCLVEHVGDSSACFPGTELSSWRRATNFRGADFDARTLLPLA